MTQFWVIGGEYQDTSFQNLATGKTVEKIGPFKSYEEAEKAWSSKAWSTVDDCNARYEIVEERAARN